MSQCSQKTNWSWFGVQTFEELDRWGKHYTFPWMAKAYRWLYNRLPNSIRQKLTEPVTEESVGPPLGKIPFAASLKGKRSGQNAGAIGFLSVNSSGSIASDDNNHLKNHAYRAALFVFDLIRPLDPEVGFPAIFLDSEKGNGASLSLSAMIASLQWILKISVPDDLIATGSFQPETSQLIPVNPETMDEKITAAVRFGYKKFAIVRGQRCAKGRTPQEIFQLLQEQGILPLDAQLTFIEVDSDPLTAFFNLLATFPLDKKNEEGGKGIAKLLALYAKKGHRWDAKDSGFADIIGPYCDSSLNLVRHVACDLMSRRSLHLGQIPKSEDYRKRAPRLTPAEFPSGWLGSYLKYEEKAARSVLEINQGRWDDELPIHQQADRLLDRLEKNIDDDAADIEDFRSALALADTKGLRNLYRARFDQQKSSFYLKTAWQETTRFQEYWEEIFQYTERLGLKDETLRRQKNQAVSCMVLWKEIFNQILPQLESIRLTPPWEDAFKNPYAMPYNLASWIDFRVLVEEPLSSQEIETFFDEAGKSGYHGYPCYLPFEKFLFYGLGTNQQRNAAKDQIRKAIQFLDESQDRGTRTIRILRAAAVLNAPDYPPKAFISHLTPGSELDKIAHSLLNSPETLIQRVPF